VYFYLSLGKGLSISYKTIHQPEKFILILVRPLLSGTLPAYSQSGLGGPQLGGTLSKLFGDNQTFSAAWKCSPTKSGKPMTMPGKLPLTRANHASRSARTKW